MGSRIRYVMLCLALVAGMAAPIYAQETPPPEPESEGITPPPPGLQLPIDDHIWVLLVMGLMLGVYFLIKKKTTVSMP